MSSLKCFIPLPLISLWKVIILHLKTLLISPQILGMSHNCFKTNIVQKLKNGIKKIYLPRFCFKGLLQPNSTYVYSEVSPLSSVEPTVR